MSKKAAFNPPTFADWAADVENDVAPTWVIPGFLPSDNLVLLSGEPKDGKKTWFAMLTALVAATGIAVGPMRCAEPVPVLYVYREGARKPTLQRFKALAAGNGINDISGLTNLFIHHRGEFWLDDKNGITDVARFIAEKGIKVCYVDTFARSCQSDENSSKDMGIAIQQLEKIRAAGATVVLVHHLKKGGHSLTNGKNGFPDPDKDIRGSSAMAGAYETHWAVRTYPGSNPKERQQTILVGGKEAEWKVYSYDWDFQNLPAVVNQERILRAAKLDMDLVGPIRYVDGPKGNSRKSEEDETDNVRELWA